MPLTPNQVQRYARHIVLREVGGPGQNALLSASVAIIGAGGLGGPAAMYLAAAGVGQLTIIDDDAVEISNLQRQVQFVDADIEKGKAQTLADRLQAQNPDCDVTVHNLRLTEENAEARLASHDVILDGTDNFATRLTVNKASYALKTPLISGALGRFDMQLGVFNTGAESPCYRCFVGDVPDTDRNCATEGVLGALAGMCGSMMAMEAVKSITGAGEPLSGRLYMYDALRAEGRTLRLNKDPACPVCA
ncbi:HesA/MoeB/ThiF family protein [Litorimonas sp. WD9-15]|uniref:HesA/MoeB/ThiF family protein n=1 Tax=Litorimonas sp. WD9-15 TaxID=3418716 RepID=UPI003D07F2A6